MKRLLFLLLTAALTSFSACDNCGDPATVLELGTDPAAFLRLEAGDRVDARFEEAIAKADPMTAHEKGPKTFLGTFLEALEQAHAADSSAKPVWEAYFPSTASSLDALNDSLLARLNRAHQYNDHLLTQRFVGRGVICSGLESDPNLLRFTFRTPEADSPNLHSLFTKSATIAFHETYLVSEAYDYLYAAEAVYLKEVLGDSTLVEEAVEEPEEEAKPQEGSFEELVAESQQEPKAEANMDEAKAKFRAEHPIFGRFDLETGIMPDQASYGYALEKDIEDIDAMFNHPLVRQALPLNLKLVWSMKPEVQNAKGQDLYAMYLLKKPRPGSPAAELSDRHIESTSVGDDGAGGSAVSIHLDGRGAKLFEELSGSNVGRHIAIVYNGRVMSAPRVNAAIYEGDIMLSGLFSIEECGEIAALLGTGALASPVYLLGGS